MNLSLAGDRFSRQSNGRVSVLSPCRVCARERCRRRSIATVWAGALLKSEAASYFRAAALAVFPLSFSSLPGLGGQEGVINHGRQRRFTTNLCCLSHGCSLSLHPPPPSLQGCQAREVGETEKDRERRKKDRKDSRNKSTNSLNPCYPVLASQNGVEIFATTVQAVLWRVPAVRVGNR